MHEKPSKQNRIRAALGFRAHSGWAALVAVAGKPFDPILVSRTRVELADRAVAGSAQPYHAASEMDWNQGADFVARCIRKTDALAQRAVKAAADDLQKMGYDVRACGVLVGSARPLPDLREILNSHPLLHTAEGQMFREALVRAAKGCSLRVATAPERDILDVARERLGLSAGELEHTLGRIGKEAGPPWRQDQKFAMIAGMLALAQ